MTKTTIVRYIDAPIETVFSCISDIRNFSQAIPHIKNVEFLTEQKVGAGTRFIETRDMHGNEASTEIEVREYSENDHFRAVADSHGTIWDTIFTVETVKSEQGEQTKLVMVMEARAYRLIPKIINPLMKGMVKKAVCADMDAVKLYCEAQPEN